ncbi:Heterokaryon incompatibility protein (HET) domain containing protein [Naviculisporaceae sp. PSN 640]
MSSYAPCRGVGGYSPVGSGDREHEEKRLPCLFSWYHSITRLHNLGWRGVHPTTDMGPEPAPLSYWPIPIPKEPVYNSDTHRCKYCEALKVSVNPDAEITYLSSEEFPSRCVWSAAIPYSLKLFDEAATSRCMFFVWLRGQIQFGQSPYSDEEFPEMDFIKPYSDEDADSDFLLKFRFYIALDGSKPALESILPSNFKDRILFSIQHKSRNWQHPVLQPWGSIDPDRFEEARARRPGITGCLYGQISSPPILLQIRDRLADCFQYHGECHYYSSKRSGIRPTRFINVDPSRSDRHVRLQTLDLDSRIPYVTLSYVWGQDQQTKTTMHSRSQYETGIAIESLPNTLRDAILVTRLIGIDLLWVDSLCIVQDDPLEMTTEIANMGSYYSNSILTLSIAAASSCLEGFLGTDPKVELKDRECGAGMDSVQFDLEFSGMDWMQSHIPVVTVNKDLVHLPVEHRRYGRHIYPLDRRAWALQETLFSTRLVTIGSRTTSWSCPTVIYGAHRLEHWRESLRNIHNVGANSKLVLTNMSSGKRWDGDDPVVGLSSVRQLVTSPFLVPCDQDDSDDSSTSGDFDPDHTVRWSLRVWSGLIHFYSTQCLSNELDILNAISGIAKELSGNFPDNPCGTDAPKYLAGLWWSDHFPASLLWEVYVYTPTREESRLGVHAMLRPCRSTAYTAPSWSWASLKIPCGVQYLERGDDIDPVFYKHVKIISCYMERRSPRAPYGAVTAGHLIFNTRITEINSQTVGLIEAYEIQLSSDTEEINLADLENGTRTLTLLEILTEKATIPSGSVYFDCPRGLILEKNHDNSYKRVGTFRHQSNTRTIDAEDHISAWNEERKDKWVEHLSKMPWETAAVKIV